MESVISSDLKGPRSVQVRHGNAKKDPSIYKPSAVQATRQAKKERPDNDVNCGRAGDLRFVSK